MTQATHHWRTCWLSMALLAGLAGCDNTRVIAPTEQPNSSVAAAVTPSPHASASNNFRQFSQDMHRTSSAQAMPEDERITTRLLNDLSNDSELSTFDIQVETLDGVVTLMGTLPNAAARSRTETLSKLSEGVKAVNNLLMVSPPHNGLPAAPEPEVSAP